MRVCQRRATSRVGVSCRSAAWMISLRTPVRFFRNWGLSSSQSGPYNLSDFALNRTCCLVQVMLLDRLAFKGIFLRSFGLDESVDRVLKSGVFLPISLKSCKLSLQVPFFSASKAEITPDCLVEQKRT